jgi:hypothetical protein
MNFPYMVRIQGAVPTPNEHAIFNYFWKRWREADSPLSKWREQCLNLYKKED